MAPGTIKCNKQERIETALFELTLEVDCLIRAVNRIEHGDTLETPKGLNVDIVKKPLSLFLEELADNIAIEGKRINEQITKLSQMLY